MRAVGIGRLARNDDVEAVGEGVLRGRADADIGLHAGDDDARNLLFVQEQGEVGGEESAVAPLSDDDFARAERLEFLKEFGVLIADEMVAWELAPFIIVEAGIVLLERMDDDPVGGARLRKQPTQRLQDFRGGWVIVRHALEEKGIGHVDKDQRC